MDSLSLVIFGITGNLSQLKLIPALYDMAEKGILPKDINIIGIARKPLTHAEFEEYFYKVLHTQNKSHTHEIKDEVFKTLVGHLYYIQGEVDNPELYKKLKSGLAKLGTKNTIFYLATYPGLYHYVFENLQRQSLNIENPGFARIMIEKPIGNDLSSAQQLNHLLLNYFKEDQIYRLDHYLGKETLQNILAFRFGNSIFEPLINKDFIDHIQITSAEEFGIGRRGGYYDNVGALKDVGQNHLLQMLAFATMNAPKEFKSTDVTKERLKILKSLKPLPEKIVFGQYEDYKAEENVSPESNIDTFFAFKTFIQDERFKGVPIYIRAGKKLTQTATEIVIIFKKTTSNLFAKNSNGELNILVYRIQPNEGIALKVLTKKPEHKLELQPSWMEFCYKLDPHAHYIPDPYERLLVDTIRGDQTFFNNAEEIEAQWAFIDPLSNVRRNPLVYKNGTWGPKEADELLDNDGRFWIPPSPDFCKI